MLDNQFQKAEDGFRPWPQPEACKPQAQAHQALKLRPGLADWFRWRHVRRG